MKNKYFIFTAFVIVALFQVYIPVNMILEREKVLLWGSEYKFKTMPVDPNDPFRGKYVALGYQDNSINIKDTLNWFPNEEIYVHIETDNGGFAKIVNITKYEPGKEIVYLKAEINSVSKTDDEKRITIDYPFDRFYMDEFKAYEAELAYRKAVRDSYKKTYAVVKIRKGNAVLVDVMIDGVSLKDLVKK